MYKENFPKRIKKARIDAGYTQAEVEEITKIKRSKISKLETGSLEPDLETLGILSEFYAVSIDWLLGIGQREKSSSMNNEDLAHRQTRALATELAKTEPFPFNILLDIQDQLISKGIIEDTRSHELLKSYIKSKTADRKKMSAK